MKDWETFDAAPDKGDSVLFGEVKREPRLSDKVAEMMLNTILSKRLQAGDRLPSERELGEQFGVSRTVVREAVRALAAKGVIEVRTGSGLRVSAVNDASVKESMKLFMRGVDLDFEKVHAVRSVLEVHIAGLAAEHASDDDIAQMVATHVGMLREVELGDIDAAALSDLAFHRVIARATHNELFLLLMDSIGSALVDIRRENLRSSGSAAATIAQEHERVLERIADHDPDGARQAMASHLDGVRALWRASVPVSSEP